MALLAVAVAAADAGSKVLRRHFGSRLDITLKGEAGNLVTNIDVAAKHAVREVLKVARPDDAVTGEELDDIHTVDADIRWSVDPLDGTTGYTRGSPYFATSVAAVDVVTGRWLVGAVNAPSLERRYSASLGGGAWLNTAAGTRRLNGSSAGTGSLLLGTGFSYEEKVRRDQYARLPELMEPFSDLRCIGSAALGLCEAADGSVDAFVESDLFEFDWAAGALITEEAGLAVTRPAKMRGGITAYANHL